MIYFLVAALVLSVLTLMHVTIGHKEVVRPLLTMGNLGPSVILPLFVCWHLLTLLMIASVAIYVSVAVTSLYKEAALSATIMFAFFALWCLVVALWKKQRHRDMPQWIVFVVVAALGLAGHFAI